MHIGIAGPIATADIASLLDDAPGVLPRGYAGAPFLSTLIAELIRRGHRVSAFTLSSDMPLHDDVVSVAHGPSLQLFYTPMRPKAWPPNGRLPGRIVDLFRFERHGLQRAMGMARPDVVHAHWAYEFAWAALSTGLPHVITSHDSPFVVARYFPGLKLGGYRWLRAAMAWHVLRHANKVTTVSPYMIEQIQPLSRTPVTLVPNPIAEAAFSQRRELVPGRKRVMMVCNGWNTLKNGRAALRAFAALSENLPEAELVACGSGFGPGEAAAQWWQAQGLKGDVRFVGAVAHAEILARAAQSDVLLHPSLEESFGAVVAEAAAMGLPIVGGERSGAVPWVAGDAGCLVDVSSVAGMALAMQQLFTSPCRIQRMGELGRAQAKGRFSVASVASQYESQYRDACSFPQPALQGRAT
jgi:glycosyltransferase involved in cell wall biosynthesis